MQDLLWLGAMIGLTPLQTIIGFIGVSCILGYSLSNGTLKTKEKQEVELKLNHYDLLELEKRLRK